MFWKLRNAKIMKISLPLLTLLLIYTLWNYMQKVALPAEFIGVIIVVKFSKQENCSFIWFECDPTHVVDYYKLDKEGCLKVLSHELLIPSYI